MALLQKGNQAPSSLTGCDRGICFSNPSRSRHFTASRGNGTMNLTVRDLLKNFETLRTAYVKAWKNGFQDVCKKLRIELAEISEQLRALGVAVGMTEEN